MRVQRLLAITAVMVCALFAISGAPSASAATGGAWLPATSVDPTFTSQYYSCGSSSYCLDVGLGANDVQQYSVFNGSSWSTPVAISTVDSGATINALACAPATAFCALGDDKGNALSETAGSWSAPTAIGAGSQTGVGSISAIACASASFCLALTDADQQVTYNGSSWSSPITGPGVGSGETVSLSCASSTLCVEASEAGAAVDSSGTWSRTGLISGLAFSDGDEMTAVSCAPGTEVCTAVDSAGNAYGYSPGTGWVTQSTGDDGFLSSISCLPNGGSVDCVAVDEDGDALSTAAPTRSASWTTAVTDQLSAGAEGFVSCTAVSACDAIDSSGFSATASGPLATSWTAGPPLGSVSLTAVSCVPLSTACEAVDATGHLVVSSGSFTTTEDVDGDRWLTTIACASTALCLAGDVDGNVLAITTSGVTSTALTSGAAVMAISCPASNWCAALSFDGSVYTYDGTRWSASTSIDSLADFPDALSCSSSSFCVATDYAGNAFAYNGSSWSKASSIDADNGLDSIACLSASFCTAGDTNGDVLTLSASGWSSPTDLKLGEISAVACQSTTQCHIATDDGIATGAGTVWSLKSGSDANVVSISCSASAYCLGVDDLGDATTFNGPPASAAAPTISGTAKTGATLTAQIGSWLGSPTSYAYQWSACTTSVCATIPGATSRT